MNKLIKIIIICISITLLYNNHLHSETIDELINEGKINYENENYKTAYEKFKEAMKINPNHFEASKWYWKMKNDHDIKNLKDKGPVHQAEESVKDKEAAKEKTAPAKPAVSKVDDRGKTDGSDKIVLRKMNTINTQVSKLYLELRKMQESGAKPVKEKTFIDIVKENPVTSGIIALIALIALVPGLGFIWFRIRIRKIPQAPAPDGMYGGVVHYTDGFADDHIQAIPVGMESKKMLTDEAGHAGTHDYTARGGINGRPQKLLPAQSAGSYDMESIAEGYIYLLEKKIQRGYNDRKVRDLAGEIGIRMGLSPDDVHELRLTALLKDVGFLMIPEKIMNKNTKFTAKNQEMIDEIETHIQFSVEIARSMALPEQVVEAINSHHERYNGTGYPEGLSGSKIPFFARIIGLSDSFIALISDRSFRKGFSIDEAVEILEKESYLFDPDVFQAFKDLIGLIKMSGPIESATKT